MDRIKSKFHPVQIILFGSWARGDAREDSDVDLLVVLPKVDHKRKAAIQIGNSLSNLPISKDIIVTTPEEIASRGNIVGNILRPALEEGKIIYERFLYTAGMLFRSTSGGKKPLKRFWCFLKSLSRKHTILTEFES